MVFFKCQDHTTYMIMEQFDFEEWNLEYNWLFKPLLDPMLGMISDQLTFIRDL